LMTPGLSAAARKHGERLIQALVDQLLHHVPQVAPARFPGSLFLRRNPAFGGGTGSAG
jgi:hypothetical protein